MGAVNTTYTFTATDTITSTKMNNIIDQTTMEPDAIIGTTLEVVSGKLKIRSQGITSNEMGANSVTTNAITDLNVTAAKLATDSVITEKIAADSVTAAKLAPDSVTTVKILDGNVTPAKLAQKITSGSAITASGTSVDFTSLPVWIKQVTVLLNGVSLSGSGLLRFRLGTSSGFVTTGYNTTSWAFNSATGNAIQQQSGGFAVYDAAPDTGDIYYGKIIFENISGNTWIGTGDFCQAGTTTTVYNVNGSIALASALTQLRVTSSNGTDTFDAGTINIIYE